MDRRAPNQPPVLVVNRRTAAVFILGIFVIFAAQGMWLQSLSSKNARAIADINELRGENTKRFQAADLRNCLAIHEVVDRDSKTIAAGPRTTRRLLEILDVPPATIERFVEAQSATVQHELDARKLRPCSTLPSLNGVRTKP